MGDWLDDVEVAEKTLLDCFGILRTVLRLETIASEVAVGAEAVQSRVVFLSARGKWWCGVRPAEAEVVRNRGVQRVQLRQGLGKPKDKVWRGRRNGMGRSVWRRNHSRNSATVQAFYGGSRVSTDQGRRRDMKRLGGGTTVENLS